MLEDPELRYVQEYEEVAWVRIGLLAFEWLRKVGRRIDVDDGSMRDRPGC